MLQRENERECEAETMREHRSIFNAEDNEKMKEKTKLVSSTKP